MVFWRREPSVAAALAASPDPPLGRKRDALARQSANLAMAFATHKKPILAFMSNLSVAMTDNQAERGLSPVKVDRKISCPAPPMAGDWN